MILRVLIAAALAASLASPLLAQKPRRDGAGPAPPPVLSQTITAPRGEKITVPLGIHGTRGELLEFLIRTPPAHGKLSPVKSTALNAATVIYTPSSRTTAIEDRFSYAARGSEGVSAPGVIEIRFAAPTAAAAKLRAPSEIEFFPVFPGERSTAEMELMNEGGGKIEGEVAVPKPWSIEGLKIFRLGAGQRATFKLIFTPAQAGAKSGEAIITGTERKVIALRAMAEERLAVSPPLVKLVAQPGSHTRKGVLNIVNRAGEDASVAVAAGARLLTDRVANIPAHGTAAVPVFADAADSGAFDDTIQLSSKEWQATVRVHAVAVGGILKFSAPDVSLAGRAGNSNTSGIAILENSGGEALTVRVDVGQPFEIENRVVTVPPRGSVDIPIFLREAAAGKFRAPLQAIGEGGTASAIIVAEISEPPAEKPAPAARQSAAESQSRAEDGESGREESETPLISQSVREVPDALGRFGHATGTTSAVLDWPASLGSLDDARVEQRVLSFAANDELQVAWAAITGAKFTQAAERARAELRDLAPGTTYTVRVVTGKGADAAVLFTADFRTASKKPFYSGSSVTPLLFLALFVLAGAIWHSRRGPRQSAGR